MSMLSDWIDSLIAKWKKKIEVKPAPVPAPVPQPSPTPQPANTLPKLTWISGPKPAGDCVQDVVITYKKHTSGSIYFTHDRLPWPNKDGDCCGISALFVKQPDGSYRGCKHDHVRATTTERDWINVHGGYGGLTEPEDGQECGFLIMSYDGKHISNMITFRWAK